MFGQTFFASSVLGMPAVDLLQAVPNKEFVIAGREDRGRHVNKYRDPRVAIVEAECLATEEDGSHNTSAQISGQVGGQRVACYCAKSATRFLKGMCKSEEED
jgi:hypothetical protein